MRPEVRMARYIEGLERYRAGRLSCEEAAELLGVSERHFRRLRDRYEADGAEGLIDRRRGRVSGRRAPVDQNRVCRRAVPDTLLGLYGEALPRGAASRARVSSRLYLDQGGVAEPRPGARGAQALGASQEETAAATAGDDAVPGRFAARVAGGSAGARLDCHLGRRHQRDLLGV